VTKLNQPRVPLGSNLCAWARALAEPVSAEEVQAAVAGVDAAMARRRRLHAVLPSALPASEVAAEHPMPSGGVLTETGTAAGIADDGAA
jgi:hypothetical protein